MKENAKSTLPQKGCKRYQVGICIPLLICPRVFPADPQNDRHSDLCIISKYGNGCCHGFAPCSPIPSRFRVQQDDRHELWVFFYTLFSIPPAKQNVNGNYWRIKEKPRLFGGAFNDYFLIFLSALAFALASAAFLASSLAFSAAVSLVDSAHIANSIRT